MKFLPTILLACALAATPPIHAASQSVQQILSDGQTAMMQGDLVTAKKNFQIVVEVDPKNPTANAFLRQIAAREAAMPKGNDMEKQLTAVIMPKVELREATLGSALEYLRQQVAKVSGGKTSVNFVLQLPEAQVNTPITLNLSTIPFTEVLKYIGDLGNVKFEYEKYAVKVKPKAGAPTATVTSSTPVATGAAQPETLPGS